ncbi:stage III sporulation protein AF [Paenibacillus sp. LHD-117]|uniref:stage III sporulation protein AF n=1 Tax=Paenibacillus sp. LHD-117 TaxID=3071412 RepID=UPI0027E1EBD7|nr:stage III sporulation protein AF [Paenibacillus sp. LHD-117]MDQ6421053.1 stage III sporulation protein AF [Paenibacillus sp. LHD-117]
MIAWLSDWLRDIIAVILLAVLVELLLPNKAMQRYARLVVGLFILLTILSPVLRLFQEDIGPKLDAGIRMWNERAADRNVKMPSLEEIERKAAELSEQRNMETARLMKRTLESGMLAELRKSHGRSVEGVDVTLVWGKKPKEGDVPDIGEIRVTLRPEQERASADVGGSVADQVDDVAPVTVQVRIEETTEQGAEASAGEESGAEGFIQVEGSEAASIKNAINQGWGVHRDRILIQVRTE